MRESKLIVVLKSFETTELKALDKFMQSPYFNNNEGMITKLWEQIQKHAPTFDANQLAKEKIYKKIFPKEDYEEKRLRQLRSRLLKVVEEFMAIERFKRDDFRIKKEVADAYLEKGIKDNFEKKYEDLKKSFKAEAFLTTSELHQKMSLYHQSYFNEHYVKGDNSPIDLVAATQLLEQYYTHQKLLYTIEWISMSNQYARAIPPSILEYSKYLKICTKTPKDSIVNLLEQASKLFLIEGKEADIVFDAVFKQFEVNYSLIPKIEKNLILRLLLNYCISKGDNGISTITDMFKLYQLGLSDEAIFYKGLMSNATFINIVTTALKQQKIDWASNFIQTEKHRLYEAKNEHYLSASEATISFYKREFESCLEQLSKMESSNMSTMEIVRRGLKIRTIFECSLTNTSYTKLLYPNIESYIKFIRRRTILSIKKRQSYLNFAKCLLRLVKWKEANESLPNLVLIKDAVTETTPFPAQAKGWLLNHIELCELKMELSRQPQIDSH